MDIDKKTLAVILASVSAGMLFFLSKKGEGSVSVSSGGSSNTVIINGKTYTVAGNKNTTYAGKSFINWLKDRSWKNTFCSDTADHCIVMSDHQMSIAKYLHALIGAAEQANKAKGLVTSGIRDQQIITALLNTGHRVSPTTDHSYGLNPNPVGRGAVDATFGRKTRQVYKWMVNQAKHGTGGFNRIYQLIYYPHENFIHMGYLGNRNHLSSDLTYMWFSDKTINGKHYHPALGTYA